MNRFQRPPLGKQFTSQPIEQFRVRRLRSTEAKIAGRIDDALPKMPVPKSIHNHTPGERIGWINNPLRQRDSTIGITHLWRTKDLPRLSPTKATGRNDRSWRFRVTAIEQMNNRRRLRNDAEKQLAARPVRPTQSPQLPIAAAVAASGPDRRHRSMEYQRAQAEDHQN